ENKLNPYFKRAKIYSFVIQLYLILLVAAAFGPMYSNAYPDRSGKGFLLNLAIMLVLKYINMTLSWWMLKIRQVSIRRVDTIIRFCLSTGILIRLILKSFIVLAVFLILISLIAFFEDRLYTIHSRRACDVLV